MSGYAVNVATPSRLHFGMLSVNPAAGRQFGGLGVMICPPSVELRLTRSDRLEAAGALSRRALAAARRAAVGETNQAAEPKARIEVLCAPRLHVGLGTGTQLAMAVAAGLDALAGRPLCNAIVLARRVGRGRRSAVGLHGFARGGLILEAGKEASHELSPLVERVDFPPAWRFLLICPRDERGPCGAEEHRALAQLPPVPSERTAALCREAVEVLLPAARSVRFDEFSEGLYRFNYTAGLSFAAIQGGPYAGPRLTGLVEWLRAQGVRGVGQSSWGPTLFALFPDEASALHLRGVLLRRPDSADLELTVAAADNRGARIEKEGKTA